MSKNIKRISLLIQILFVFAILFANCAVLLDILQGAKIKKPIVGFESAKLTGLSFDKADLLFNIRVENPNSIGINLNSFTYELSINNSAFLSGNQDKGFEIVANGKEVIRLPLELKFKDIYQTYRSLENNDSSIYELNCELGFDLPVLGLTRIPINKSGTVPLIKIPKVTFQSLKLNRLSLTGADLIFEFKIDNPNYFSMLVRDLDYNLNIEGKSWISGKMAQSINISNQAQKSVEIPLTLNFMQIGSSVYLLINGDQSLNYHFSGNANFQSDLSLLKSIKLPFDRSGQFRLIK